MKLTFEAKTRSIETYELQLEPAPALLLGAKPSKGDDADSSTVASSIPDTPIKSAEVFTLSVSEDLLSTHNHFASDLE